MLYRKINIFHDDDLCDTKHNAYTNFLSAKRKELSIKKYFKIKGKVSISICPQHLCL